MSTRRQSSGTLSAVVEDASTFPPASVPLDEAVAHHRELLDSECADLVGPFVLTDARVPALAPLLDDLEGTAPLDARLVVTGGAGALEPAARWAGRTAGLRLRGLAIRLRDEADLAHNAARTVAMVDHLRSSGDLAEEVEVHVEPPRLAHCTEHGWLAALDELAMADLRLRLRTGGADPQDAPEPAELARCIDAALDREMPFTCAGDLGRAAYDGTGGHHYGFLGVLLATRTALDGGDVTAALTSPAPVDAAGLDALAPTRRWFTSFTATSVLDVHEDLVEHDLWRR